MDTVCIIGHSHGRMLKKGLKLITHEPFFYISPLIGNNEFTLPASFKAEKIVSLNKDVDSLINKLQVEQGLEKIHLLTAFQGNVYNRFYMIEDDEPFDFMYEDEDADENRRFVSKKMVESCLDEYLIATMNALTILMQKDMKSVACLQTPPPNPSEEFMMNKLRIVRGDFADNLKISPGKLRLKLWRTMDAMYRKTCDELGVLYICAPENTRDEDGFLLEEFWGDMAHANQKYGAIMLEEHQKLINKLDKRDKYENK